MYLVNQQISTDASYGLLQNTQGGLAWYAYPGYGIQEYFSPFATGYAYGPTQYIGWTNFAFTFDHISGAYNIYINGMSVYSSTANSTIWTTTSVNNRMPKLAGSFNSHSVKAYFTDFRGYNISRAASSIQNEYNAVVAARPSVPGSSVYPACACGYNCGAGLVFCLSTYGGSPSADPLTNTEAYDQAVLLAVNFASSIVVFDAMPGSIYSMNITESKLGSLSQGYQITIDGNGCTVLIVNPIPFSDPSLVYIAGAGQGAQNTVIFQNMTMDVVYPPWAQGYFVRQLNSSAWLFNASGLIPDPINIGVVGYVYQFNADLSNFVAVSGYQACPGTFSMNTSTSPSQYILVSSPGCPTIGSSTPPGTPFAIAFDNIFNMAERGGCG